MDSSAEMRETSKKEKIDYVDRGKVYPGLITHWVCVDKYKCKARVESNREEAARRAV